MGFLYDLKAFLWRHFVLISTIICMLIGLAIGVIMKIFGASDVASLYIGLPGELFMRALYFGVLPLLSCNIITISAKLQLSNQGMIALLALSYCIIMNICGAFIGVGTTILINPGGRDWGENITDTMSTKSSTIMSLVDVFPDFLRNMVPDNILKTLLYSTVTTYSTSTMTAGNNTNESVNHTTNITYQRDVGTSSGPNILGILFSSLVLGLIAGSRADKTRPFIALAEAVTEVMTVLVEKTVSLLPLAMISLIASAVSSMTSLREGLISLALFVAATAVYLIIIAFILMPLVFLILVQQNLFRYYRHLSSPLLTAFSLTSSLIALPDLFHSCERIGVRPHVVRTIAPFLTSFNANGSAAFIAASACFASQLAGQPLSAPQIISIGFLAGLNVMALPAVPSASLITVFLINRVFGLPESGVALLLVVEFINDRMRTMVNVLSHGTCVVFVHLKTESSFSSTSSSILEVEVQGPAKDSLMIVDYPFVQEPSTKSASGDKMLTVADYVNGIPRETTVVMQTNEQTLHECNGIGGDVIHPSGNGGPGHV